MDSFHYITFLFALLFLSLGVQIHSDESLSMRERYQQWMIEHKKKYTSSIEQEGRFQIFQKNVKFIDAHNVDRNKSYTLGLNPFTDLTNEEFVARATGYKPPLVWNTSASYIRPNESILAKLPKNWDWRRKGAVTPIKQQPCGNCWAFVGISEVESVNFIATGKLYRLSPQEITDCNDTGGGCKGGVTQEVYEYVKRFSVTFEANYPNTEVAQKCDQAKRAKNRFARVTSYVNMPLYVDDLQLMTAVVGRPVAVGVDSQDQAFKEYRGGIFAGPCGNNVNHAVQIVGFGQTFFGKKYWIVRNTWGPKWGERGYMRLLRGTTRRGGVCGININPTYPVY